MKSSLKIIPLGGLGEIGMNNLVVEYDRKAILVDCGVMFADDHLPGIDLVVPDFSYLLENDIDLRAIVLTHGHEDHIGAIPFLLRERNVPVYGSKFTLALVRERLKEHGLLSDAEIHLVKEGDRTQLDPFQLEWIQMSHSIADALALSIDTPEGRIIHTGDFKIDPQPVDGRKTDLERFGALGKEGVLLLLSDSTNVEVPGDGQSERVVYDGLRAAMKNAPSWVVLAFFASHVPRMKQVVELAQETGRKIHVAGRSMIQNFGIAREFGYIKAPDELVVNLDEALELPRNQLLILSTGTQGEPRSALARMAFDQHKELKIEPGDRVILSSRFIPGNEKAIYAIVNHLYRRGAEVITAMGADVHVSGHAYRNDLKRMVEAVRPKYFIPVHGEYRHLVKHVQVAREGGVSEANTLLLEDGDIAEFHAGKGRKSGKLELGRSVLDGKELADIGSAVLRDRRHLAETGLLVIVVIIDSHSGEILRGPELFARGLVFEQAAEDLMPDVREIVCDTIEDFDSEARTDEVAVQEEIRASVRRFFKNRIDRKPVVIPIVMEV